MNLQRLVERWRGKRPRLSIIVVMHDMRREAARTLLSLTPAYQRGIDGASYEVLVIDNNSSAPLDADWVRSFGPQFRYLYHETASKSPVGAINRGARLARGDQLGIVIDGARILTPGVLQLARVAAAGFAEPVVATLNWLLGPKMQHLAAEEGYDQAVEDRMLADAGWPDDPYALHRISVLGGSSASGYFHPLAESNGLFLSRALFDRLGGYDERFDSDGGGLANLDFYRRACDAAGTDLVVLLGEGTFHQIHGGIMTNAPKDDKKARWNRFAAEYERIRGEPFQRSQKQPIYMGPMPADALDTLDFSTRHALEARNRERS